MLQVLLFLKDTPRWYILRKADNSMNPTKEPYLGNQLNRIVQQSRALLFVQGELAQLSYSALESAANTIQAGDKAEIEVTYPVGYTPAKQPILGKRKYQKEQLLDRYRFLADTQLALNGIYQLITIIGAMLGDLVRAIVLKYPQKLGTKRSVSTGVILEASSLEEIHLHAIDSVLNDLSYKSPHEFAESIKVLMSLNLLECPAYHRYTETKASRDILIHNQGIANHVYVAKSGSHARVASGQPLPINTGYFLESYESCLQFSEWIEKALHNVWHSSEYEIQQAQQQAPQQGDG